MGLLNKKSSVFSANPSVLKTLMLCTFLMLFASVSYAGKENMKSLSDGHMSSTEVRKHVEETHDGKVIYTKRTDSEEVKKKYPNCHTVKMLGADGEFRYIRYGCGSD